MLCCTNPGLGMIQVEVQVQVQVQIPIELLLSTQQMVRYLVFRVLVLDLFRYQDRTVQNSSVQFSSEQYSNESFFYYCSIGGGGGRNGLCQQHNVCYRYKLPKEECSVDLVVDLLRQVSWSIP